MAARADQGMSVSQVQAQHTLSPAQHCLAIKHNLAYTRVREILRYDSLSYLSDTRRVALCYPEGSKRLLKDQ